MSQPQAIAVRGIRGRGPAGIGEHVVTTDKNGQFVFKNIIGFATKNDVASGAYSPQSANPTATAKDTAVNGTAKTFMTSDSAPAVQKTSSSVFGIAKVDGTTITASGGVISAVQPAGANPTAVASDVAVNGSALTFMRSDGAPAVQKTSASVFGLAKVDGSTITAASGVISAVAGTQFALPPIVAPAAPASGFILYCDAADNKLKAIAASSAVTTLATQ